MPEESGFQVGRDAPLFYETQVRRFMEPFVDALVSATVTAGDAVLDVACGTGFATRAAASVVGAGGRVEGADLNPAMINQAQTVPNTSEATLSWSEASALDLPFANDEFDAAISQQGLQFFPDPAAGLREMVRVVRAGGRIGVTVWSPSEQTPFLHRETEMLARHGGGEQAGFSATETELRSWFASAGLGSVAVERLEVEVDLPPVLSYVPEHLKALPWSARFFELSAEEQRSALDELDRALGEYQTLEGMRVPFSSFVATATV